MPPLSPAASKNPMACRCDHCFENQFCLSSRGCNAQVYNMVKKSRIEGRSCSNPYAAPGPRAQARSPDLAGKHLPCLCRRSPTLYLEQSWRAISGRGSDQHGVSQGAALAERGSERGECPWLALCDGTHDDCGSL